MAGNPRIKAVMSFQACSISEREKKNLPDLIPLKQRTANITAEKNENVFLVKAMKTFLYKPFYSAPLIAASYSLHINLNGKLKKC